MNPYPSRLKLQNSEAVTTNIQANFVSLPKEWKRRLTCGAVVSCFPAALFGLCYKSFLFIGCSFSLSVLICFSLYLNIICITTTTLQNSTILSPSPTMSSQFSYSSRRYDDSHYDRPPSTTALKYRYGHFLSPKDYDEESIKSYLSPPSQPDRCGYSIKVSWLLFL
jgi:hypothetical protein